MKRSSKIILLVILLVFGAIQGWVLHRKFLLPSSVRTLQATLLGETMMVGTPVSGIVRSVHVRDGQYVERGEPLLTVLQQTPLDPHGGMPVTVVAQRAGHVYGITAIPDSFVQASEILARVIDTSADGLYVEALLSVRPEDLPALTPGLPASVRASFLEEGRELPAAIAGIGMYDGVKSAVSVRLRFLAPLTGKSFDTVIGLPVAVSVLPKKDAPPHPDMRGEAVAATAEDKK